MSETPEIFDRSGWTSTIYHVEGYPDRVCKSFDRLEEYDVTRLEKFFNAERRAYERFSAAENCPSGLLRYYGVHETLKRGLILELVENRSVWSWLRKCKRSELPGPSPDIILRWAFQAAEALEFAHGLGVLNSDIHAINCFLDKDLNLKVGDWAGATIDGSRPACTYRFKYRYVDQEGIDEVWERGISVKTEIFALGTALYHFETGHELWPELEEGEVGGKDEIKKKIQLKEFPELKELSVLGKTIAGCWNLDFKTMSEVKQSLIS